MKENEKEFDEKKCREAANYDLRMCIAFLNLLYRDPQMLKAVEDLIVERTRAHYENKKLNPEIDFDGTK